MLSTTRGRHTARMTQVKCILCVELPSFLSNAYTFAAAIAWDGEWATFGESSYKFFGALVSGDDARAECLAEGASLVQIESEEEQRFLASLAPQVLPGVEQIRLGE